MEMDAEKGFGGENSKLRAHVLECARVLLQKKRTHYLFVNNGQRNSLRESPGGVQLPSPMTTCARGPEGPSPRPRRPRTLAPRNACRARFGKQPPR